MTKVLLAFALAGLSSVSIANDDNKISKDIELGIISTSGNTETNSLKGKLSLLHDLKRTKNQFVLEGFYKEDQVEIERDGEIVTENQVTAEKYFLSNQLDFKLQDEHKGLFIFGSYEQDEFSGLEFQSTLAAGYSDRLFEFERSHLDFSVGPGVSFQQAEDTVDENGNIIDGDSEQDVVIRLSFSFLYNISETAKFTQTFSSDVATDQGANTKTKAESAISANMTNSLALKASFIVDQDTHPEEGRTHADTQTAITLVYSI